MNLGDRAFRNMMLRCKSPSPPNSDDWHPSRIGPSLARRAGRTLSGRGAFTHGELGGAQAFARDGRSCDRRRFFPGTARDNNLYQGAAMQDASLARRAGSCHGDYPRLSVPNDRGSPSTSSECFIGSPRGFSSAAYLTEGPGYAPLGFNGAGAENLHPSPRAGLFDPADDRGTDDRIAVPMIQPEDVRMSMREFTGSGGSDALPSVGLIAAAATALAAASPPSNPRSVNEAISQGLEFEPPSATVGKWVSEGASAPVTKGIVKI